MTGEWAFAPSTRHSDDEEPQTATATTMAVEKSGNAGPPDDDAEKGFQRTALRMLAAELAGSDDDPTQPPRQGADPDDSPGCEPAALSGSGSSLTAQGEARYYREIARLGAQVADALGHAHKRGVFHRDIKPSNLILDGQGNIWITDFGLAKFEDGDDLTHSQDLVGTLRFMAPERFHGLSDPRCDVYALGATLYEMVTLRPCFSGQSHAQLIHRIEHEPPVPPRQIEPGIPLDLETIILKALAKAPARSVRERRRDGRRIAPICGEPTDPIAADPGLPAVLALVQTKPRTGHVRHDGCGRDHRAGHRLVGRRQDLQPPGPGPQASSADERAERKALELGNSLLTEGAAHQRSGLVGQRFDSLDRLERAAQILGADPEGRRPIARNSRPCDRRIGAGRPARPLRT